MMESRLGWFIVGLIAGTIVGYLVRAYRGNQEDEFGEDFSHKHEGGFVTPQWLSQVALLLVVLLTAFAAFTSQKSSNKSDDNTDSIAQTQLQITKTSECNQMYVGLVITALNARTQFSQEQNQAIIALQKAQALFLGGFLKAPTSTTGIDRKAFTQYFQALTTYTTVAGKSSKQVAANPYPTAQDFTNCLKGK